MRRLLTLLLPLLVFVLSPTRACVYVPRTYQGTVAEKTKEALLFHMPPAVSSEQAEDAVSGGRSALRVVAAIAVAALGFGFWRLAHRPRQMPV